MINNSHFEIGMHHLRFARTELELVFDPRSETLSFESGNDWNSSPPTDSPTGVRSIFGFSVRLERFIDFEEDLNRLDKESGPLSEFLLNVLQEIATNSEPPPTGIWSDVIGDFAFFLLRYARKHHRTYLAVAKDILVWLGATSANTAWRVSYDDRLAFEHRYRLLKDGRSERSGVPQEGNAKGELDLPDQKEREYFWWGTMVGYELSQDWCKSETYGNPMARQALRKSAIEYLHVLKNERRQHDLQRFLSESGTDIEREVKGVLFGPFRDRQPNATGYLKLNENFHGPENNKFLGTNRFNKSAKRGHVDVLGLAKDEVIRRAFFVWFLKRYDWLSARKLILSVSKKSRFRIAIAFLFGFNLLAGLLYVVQIREFNDLPRYLSFLPSPETHTPTLWTIQALLQLGSLLLFLLIAPALFRLLMPRALFGCLLAWSTVIFTALRDVHELKMQGSGDVHAGKAEEYAIMSLCHSSSCTDAQAFGYTLLICAGILLLDLVFIGYTVTQFTEGFWTTLSRIFSTLGFLLLGSLFWGLIFALPVKVALERDSFMVDCHCIIPIVLIGSSIAVFFGLMLELIWQDQSLAEPLGESL